MDSDRPYRFTDWLADHRNGVADADLTDAFRELAERCGRTGKAGEMTIRIKMSPKGDMLAVTDSLAVKLPVELEERLYWVDLEGNLTRQHPLQPRLTRPDGTAPDNMRVGPPPETPAT